MKAWLKAGLAGAALEILTTLPATLFYILPGALGSSLTCCASVAYLLALPLVGVLAGAWLEPPVTVRKVLPQSALAGLLAASLDGVFTVALTAVLYLSGAMTRYFESAMPGVFTLANENEAFRFYFSLPGQVISTSLCAAGMLVVAVGASVLGGLLYAAIKQGGSAPGPGPQGMHAAE